MKLPSPSKLDLAELCGFPWTAGIRWPQLPSRPEAAHGFAVHEAADCHVKGLPVDVEALAAKHGIRTDSDRKTLQLVVGHVLRCIDADSHEVRLSELRIAYNPTTGKARLIERWEEKQPGEQAGEIDYLAGIKPGHVLVRDWKTGRRKLLSTVREARQAQWYALAVAALLGADEVTVQLAWCSEDGVWLGDQARFDAWKLLELREQHAELVARLQRPHKPRFGLHCHELHCPIVSECPATQKALAVIDEAAAPQWPISAHIQSPEHALELLGRVRAMRAALDNLKAALEVYASTKGAIPLGDGRWWGLQEQPGRDKITVTAEALEVIRGHLGEHADKALSYATSKTALKDAVRTLVAADGETGTRGALKRRIGPLHDELRAIGALKQGPSWTKVTEFIRAPETAGEKEQAA